MASRRRVARFLWAALFILVWQWIVVAPFELIATAADSWWPPLTMLLAAMPVLLLVALLVGLALRFGADSRWLRLVFLVLALLRTALALVVVIGLELSDASLFGVGTGLVRVTLPGFAALSLVWLMTRSPTPPVVVQEA